MAGTIIPNIVTSGLIHYSDVANPKFYPGGSSVYSLLTGGEGQFNSGAGVTGGSLDKAFILDGVDDTITIDNSYTKSVSALPVTIDLWAYVDSDCPIYHMIFSTSQESFYRGASVQADMSGVDVAFKFSYYDGSGGIGSGNRRSFRSPHSFEFNQWYHITCVITGNSSGSFYCNGEEYSLTNDGAYFSTALQISNTYPANIGKANGYPYYFKGRVSNIKVYDRALTKAESIQNFNAHRKRYNL
jgi:hypothetical protein